MAAASTPLDAVAGVARAFAEGEPAASEVAAMLGGSVDRSANALAWTTSGGVSDAVIVLAQGRVPPAASEVSLTFRSEAGLKLGDLVSALGPYRPIKDSGEHGLVRILFHPDSTRSAVAIGVTLLLPVPEDQAHVIRVTIRRADTQ